VPRFALYALCAAAAALAVWLVLGTLAPDEPGGAGEPHAGRAAVAEPGPAAAPGEVERPEADPAHLVPVPPDPERGELQADIEMSARAGLGGISDAGFAQPGFAQPGAAENPRERDSEEAGSAPAPLPIGGGIVAPSAPVPAQGDPRVLLPLENEPQAAAEATPIEPEPERPGNLADPDVQPSVLHSLDLDPDATE